MSIENSGLRFLKGSDLSGVDTHDPRADITPTEAAPRQTTDHYTLSESSIALTSSGVNHRSSKAERFAESPAVSESSQELSMSEIFNPESTARLSKDLFMEGVRQSKPVSSVPTDNTGEIADVGNLLFALLKHNKNSQLS